MYYSNETGFYIPPEILIINVDNLSDDIHQLEYDTGIQVSSDETLSSIINCIQVENNARLELEVYCVNLVSSHCNGQFYGELKTMLAFLIDFGNIILRDLKSIGVYQNGIFPYTYRNRKYNAVRFIRNDALLEQIKKELAAEGLYNATRCFNSQFR